MTFSDLQDSLAYISGQKDRTGFTAPDLALCKQVINEAYLNCYLPDETKAWPRFARRGWGIQFQAQQSLTLTFTAGSTTFTGWTPPTPDVFVGSKIKVGTAFYTYAGKDSTTATKIVEPWDQASGSYGAVLYHGSYPLDASVLQFCEAPEIQGWGVLSPIAGRETDILYRSNFFDGFRPLPGDGYQRATARLFGGSTFDTGQPLFYMVSEPQLLDNGDARLRLELRPMPEQVTNVLFEAQYAPASLSADNDTLRLPGDLVAQILLPILRGRWAMTFKKYTGNNGQALAALAARAESQLNNMRVRQKRRGLRCDVAHC